MNSETNVSRNENEIGVALCVEHVKHIFRVIAGENGDFRWRWLWWPEW